MRLMSLFYGFVFMSLLYMALIMTGMKPQDFIDLPSAFFVFAGILFTLTNFKFSELLQAIKDAINSPATQENIGSFQLSTHIFKSMGNYVVASSIIGVILGIIQALGNLHEVRAIGPAIAVSLIVPLYAVFFKTIFLGFFTNSIERKLVEIKGVQA